MLTTLEKKDLVIVIAERLEKNNNSPETELTHSDERELLIAVCLSAQTTDKKVNEVTPELFRKYNSWESLSQANVDDVIKIIRPVNFHKGKADRLIKAARFIIENFKGKIPNTIEDLIKIPGVARKSANVILNEVFDKAEGLVVDTHVIRLSNRLGLTALKDPKKIEKELMDILPKNYWRNFSANLVLHGRYICKAKKPFCENCFLNDICPSAFRV
ncbi:MAG: endonuclease III [Proteobacteria bacterium]|nr:endonuclease III [Pseudomonadota bacterium]